jgi:hypothetical protein
LFQQAIKKRKSDDTQNLSSKEDILIDIDLRMIFNNKSTEFVEFVVDVGRFLGYYQMSGSSSWNFAGRSYQFGCFCKFYCARKMHPNLSLSVALEKASIFYIAQNNNDKNYKKKKMKTTTSSSFPDSSIVSSSAAASAINTSTKTTTQSSSNHNNTMTPELQG